MICSSVGSVLLTVSLCSLEQWSVCGDREASPPPRPRAPTNKQLRRAVLGAPAHPIENPCAGRRLGLGIDGEHATSTRKTCMLQRSSNLRQLVSTRGLRPLPLERCVLKRMQQKRGGILRCLLLT